ncbi:MAG: cation transporter [Acidobacteria bacterium]|nr:cation transporter [Acidobacteriota bacterium]
MAQNIAARIDLIKRGKLLEYFTIGWNLLEAVVAVGLGILAGSVALVGFGIDSLIECLSGSILLWRLGDESDAREKIAIRLVGGSFIILAGYVTFDALKALIYKEAPETSYVGIALAIVSILIMPLLARAKKDVGEKLNSRAMVADSKQTNICAYLSVILLGGLVLNGVFGWWWADPVAALIMIPIIVKEGIEGLRGEVCEDGCH